MFVTLLSHLIRKNQFCRADFIKFVHLFLLWQQCLPGDNNNRTESTQCMLNNVCCNVFRWSKRFSEQSRPPSACPSSSISKPGVSEAGARWCHGGGAPPRLRVTERKGTGHWAAPRGELWLTEYRGKCHQLSLACADGIMHGWADPRASKGTRGTALSTCASVCERPRVSRRRVTHVLPQLGWEAPYQWPTFLLDITSFLPPKLLSP